MDIRFWIFIWLVFGAMFNSVLQVVKHDLVYRRWKRVNPNFRSSSKPINVWAVLLGSLFGPFMLVIGLYGLFDANRRLP